jgi:hypothetical protein
VHAAIGIVGAALKFGVRAAAVICSFCVCRLPARALFQGASSN